MDYSMHTYDNAKSSRASACIRNKMKKFPVSSRVHRKEIRLSSAAKIRFSGNLQVRLAVFEQNHHDYLRRNFWPSLLRLSKPLPASVGEMTLTGQPQSWCRPMYLTSNNFFYTTAIAAKLCGWVSSAKIAR